MISEYQTICGTKASRIKHANILSSILLMAGATVNMRRDDSNKEVAVHFEIGPHEGWVDFWAHKGLHSFLVHWHGDREYPRNFAVVIGGTVNSYHHQKATAGYQSFVDLALTTLKAVNVLKANLLPFQGIEFKQDQILIGGGWWSIPETWHYQQDGRRFNNRRIAEEAFIQERNEHFLDTPRGLGVTNLN